MISPHSLGEIVRKNPYKVITDTVLPPFSKIGVGILLFTLTTKPAMTKLMPVSFAEIRKLAIVFVIVDIDVLMSVIATTSVLLPGAFTKLFAPLLVNNQYVLAAASVQVKGCTATSPVVRFFIVIVPMYAVTIINYRPQIFQKCKRVHPYRLTEQRWKLPLSIFCTGTRLAPMLEIALQPQRCHRSTILQKGTDELGRLLI